MAVADTEMSVFAFSMRSGIIRIGPDAAAAFWPRLPHGGTAKIKARLDPVAFVVPSSSPHQRVTNCDVVASRLIGSGNSIKLLRKS